PPGQVTGVIGPNGAGKTSLLSGIGGIFKAGGRVHLDGHDISSWPAHRRGQAGVTFVAERRRVFPSLSVRENLLAGGWGLDKDEVASRIDEVYEMFPRLREREGVPPFRLSGGEQRMLSIGRALVTGARCLLFDELSLGLSPKLVVQLTETVRQLAAQGRMIVLVEQYIGVLLAVADHVHVLERGRSVFDGATAETAGWLEEHGYIGARHRGKTEERALETKGAGR
ncbi:MAG TPA: ATP-binding cassette domain-containing protein, partial [Acidimicrobiia bacterium]|nr:ATP-binding cassette domain-containing protein [Acidimicrobiia bacterium]